ncbi:MAG TPA: acyclic terpene utilization AtuA family protein, partial [Usitatibacteraceae bacterium]|nr:acyclic terpene utilization AtuA family protein [Usitatibacteraceae bacterium]
VGYPVAEIAADGSCVIGKAAQTGGCVTLATVKEQLLYEVHDPAAYLTPDVTADIRDARLAGAGPDRVALSGVRGHERPATLKVTAFYEGGWLAEGEISYAGPGAEARARLAADILARRLPELRLRVDLIGVVSVFADDAGRLLESTPWGDARDVRLRVAAMHAQREVAERLGEEVTALYTCGPAGGGGVRTAIRQRLSTASCFVPREAVHARFDWVN